ncbi:isoaspartyl peptidase/L-asparaginase family protein [Parachitinimonas caeni]|uniref:Isoaspartyl peptidase/L-asparaginase n=1 Tax=Parachitinimonas caeni TaxID=3031301 RepID=A0ABT7DRG2_9NEIS|nr:isoaspartyl peptidase/L-asparaginase [Parachitinimonas caeni]MDK2122640.1 isoaspartyl peptidase/L-asparaginase [Parachitinimonas caeni]
MTAPIAMAIHGGAGTIRRTDLTPEREAAIRAGLNAALDAGLVVLQAGGGALDAVEAAVIVLEDDPLFNAGRGAVFNDAGLIELEAAIMDGPSRRAGSVTGARRVRNPVRLARRIMEQTPHVTLGFAAADAFAEIQGLALADADYFFTQTRWDALQSELARLRDGGAAEAVSEQVKHGTVGAVALDCQGHLAAATSTGGRTAKMAGRIGDTPVIGAGTWADDRVAVSGTGHGEFFIRCAVGHDIAARIRYGHANLVDACDAVINQEMVKMGGTGGVIAIDHAGHIAMPFNCEGMYRAAVDAEGKRQIAIYRET